jgi:glycosyltransferase involved in cell wall biosynthesis
VAACRPVHVLGLRRPDDEPDGTVDGVRVQRLNVQRHQGSGLFTYLREYLTFLARSGWATVRAYRRERFALVQVHSLPDFLVFAALPLRMVGVPVILDLHEAMPEFFRTRFARAANPFTHRLLLLQERASIAFSTAVLTVNEAAADRLLGLGVPAAKVSIVRNAPALARFDPEAHANRPFALDGTIRLLYTGALTPTYEVDVALRAMALIRERRPDMAVRLDVYGRGDSEPDLRAQATALGLADRVAFHGRIPLDDVPRAIAAADIGLAPTRLDRYTEMTLSTKVFEYAAMGKPVVASRLPMVERTFPAGSVATYRPGDAEAMAAAILGFIDDPARRDDAVERARAIVLATAWEREAERYVALIDRFALDRP